MSRCVEEPLRIQTRRINKQYAVRRCMVQRPSSDCLPCGLRNQTWLSATDRPSPSILVTFPQQRPCLTSLHDDLDVGKILHVSPVIGNAVALSSRPQR